MSRFARHDRLLIINTVHQISHYARNFPGAREISSVARNLMKVFDFMVVVMSNEVRHLKSGKQLRKRKLCFFFGNINGQIGLCVILAAKFARITTLGSWQITCHWKNNLFLAENSREYPTKRQVTPALRSRRPPFFFSNRGIPKRYFCTNSVCSSPSSI